ncbi:MAG: hypothetical protein ACFB5Z_14670 [Elainellaceae cyanobacterium]
MKIHILKIKALFSAICVLSLNAYPVYAQNQNTQGTGIFNPSQVASPNAGSASGSSAPSQNTSAQAPGQQIQVSPARKEWYEVASVFAWPAVAVVALLLFRAGIADLLSALAKNMQKARVKMLGVEFEVAHIQNTEQFKKYSRSIGEKPTITGDPDNFKLLAKASNSRFTKSTKVMNLRNGCLVQVSTREVMDDNSIAVAEAITFVPSINIDINTTYENQRPEQYEKVTFDFISAPDASS